MNTYNPHIADANAVLSQLTREEYNRLKPHYRLVPLVAGQRLYDAAISANTMYFPLSGIVSLTVLMEDGTSGEVAIVGSEGLMDISVYLNQGIPTNEAIVQSPGRAISIPARFVLEEFHRGGNFRDVLLRYSQALFSQVAHTALCNRHHIVEQQLARWLLMSMDRLRSPEMAMSQRLIAGMLGVRRESVNEAAGRLQKKGCISYRRGKIRILDRTALAFSSCECYRAITRGYTDFVLATSEANQPLAAQA